jgi:plastocyanin
MNRSFTRAQRPVRMGRTLPGLGIALVAVAIAAAPVAGATYTVRMDNSYDFDPRTRTIARGDTVKWKNVSSFQDHDVRATAPNGYFASPQGEGGLDPGESYSFAFRSAGTYPYVCLEHAADGMTGKVKVPMRATRDGNRFKLTVASADVSSSYRHQIYVDRPGSSGWTLIARTTNNIAFYTPQASGTYKFKSRLERLSGGTSKFSPVVSITR